jgi:hypothetical protein
VEVRFPALPALPVSAVAAYDQTGLHI